MSMLTKYKETFDFGFVVSRQLDRVMEAYTSIEYDTPGPGVRRLYMAVRALYVLTQIFVPEDLLEKLSHASERMRNGSNVEAVRILEDVIATILDKLNERGLLIRRKDIMGVVEE